MDLPLLLEAEKPNYLMVLSASPETDLEASETSRTMLAKDWLVPDALLDNPRYEHVQAKGIPKVLRRAGGQSVGS